MWYSSISPCFAFPSTSSSIDRNNFNFQELHVSRIHLHYPVRRHHCTSIKAPLTRFKPISGGLGFARFAFEPALQEADLDTFVDVIIVASASGGTLAGMIAGFKLLALHPQQPHGNNTATRPRKIIGVDTFVNDL